MHAVENELILSPKILIQKKLNDSMTKKLEN